MLVYVHMGVRLGLCKYEWMNVSLSLDTSGTVFASPPTYWNILSPKYKWDLSPPPSYALHH